MFSSQVIKAVSDVRAQSQNIDLTDPDILKANLLFMYQVIVSSVRLMKEAAEESTGDLRDYYLSHIDEERNHDEWLAEDLTHAGIDVKTLPTMRKALELAGSQYYLIKHVNPAALLGYMAVLEGFPFPIGHTEMLEKIHGKKILRTLRYHSEHDLEHRNELFKMIDLYPCQELITNAIQTAIYINEFVQELNQAKEQTCH